MLSKDIGDIGEVTVLAKFVKMGIEIYKPFSEKNKVDYVADFNGKLNKIQVKSCAKMKNEAVYEIDLTSTHRKGTKTYKYYYDKNDIDFFACYCLQRQEPILIPVSCCEGKNTITIRVKPQKRVGGNNPPLYESDFFFEKIIIDYPISPDCFNEEDFADGNHCIDCGEVILDSSTRCLSCEIKRRTKEKEEKFPLTRKQLKDKIRTQSFVSIGTELNTSDNNIRKWCKHFQLPYTKKDINAYSDEEWALI